MGRVTNNFWDSKRKKEYINSVSFPEKLPIFKSIENIKQTILENQVIICTGETGSGKSTQLPKIAISLGYGFNKKILITQPRRVAAKAISEKISTELVKGELFVGFKTRFENNIKKENLINVVTDGILLAEFRSDPEYGNYEFIIIDEAHERSVNIDFILSFIKKILSIRKDLKVIITSATFNTKKFSNFFNDAPILSLEGRTFEVDIKYVKEVIKKDEKINFGIEKVIQILETTISGDILFFLPGEYEILQACKKISGRLDNKINVLPLFSKLTSSDQKKVFEITNKRKVIVATNIAESSLTIPNIKFVIDSGLSKQKRINFNTGLESLIIDFVSKASANQRSGRSGRTGPGVCYRIYTEKEYEKMSDYDTPEIFRVSMSSVILRIISLGEKNIQDFDFIDSLSPKSVSLAYEELKALKLIDEKKEITYLGNKIVNLSLDIRLGKSLFESLKFNSFKKLSIICSGLSVDSLNIENFFDDFQEEIKKNSTELIVYLELWKLICIKKTINFKNKKKITANQIQQWVKIKNEIDNCFKKDLLDRKITANTSENLFAPLLMGFYKNIGIINHLSEKRFKVFYKLPTNNNTLIHPSSIFRKKKFNTVFFLQILKTNSFYGFYPIQVKNEWIAKNLNHILKEKDAGLIWRKKAIGVFNKKVKTYFNLINVDKRYFTPSKIHFIDAQNIFIVNFLLNKEYEKYYFFIKYNLQFIIKMNSIKNKLRDYSLHKNKDDIISYFADLIPNHINSYRGFDTWYMTLSKKDKQKLLLRKSWFLKTKYIEIKKNYPEYITNNGIKIKLNYTYELDSNLDGVTAVINIEDYERLIINQFTYLTQGLLEEKFSIFLKKINKIKKLNSMINVQHIEIFTNNYCNYKYNFNESFFRFYNDNVGEISLNHINKIDYPNHLKINFQLVCNKRNYIESGKNLERLVVDYKNKFSIKNIEKKIKYNSWEFEDLPVFSLEDKGSNNIYTFLKDYQNYVQIESSDKFINAYEQHFFGVARLIFINQKSKADYFFKNIKFDFLHLFVFKHFSNISDNTLSQKKTYQYLIFIRALRKFFYLNKYSNLIFKKETFEYITENSMTNIFEHFFEEDQRLVRCFSTIKTIFELLNSNNINAYPLFKSSLESSLRGLFNCEKLMDYPVSFYERLEIYLKAIIKRINKIHRNYEKDLKWNETITFLETKMLEKIEAFGIDNMQEIYSLKKMFEELKVSLWAQELIAEDKVSFKRLEKRIDALN